MLRFQDNVGSLLERKLQDFVHFPHSFEEQYLQEEYIYIYVHVYVYSEEVSQDECHIRKLFC